MANDRDCACIQWCGDVPEDEDDPLAICKRLPGYPPEKANARVLFVPALGHVADTEGGGRGE